MTTQRSQELDQKIIELAKNSGASLAGIARVKDLKSSPAMTSFKRIHMLNDEANVKTIGGDPDTQHVRYCRACELSCPVGQ